jgi:hypothetical protein
MSFEMKKQYLLKRINEESNLLTSLSRKNSELLYILSQAKDKFFYSAPEVVDECFSILKKIISLDEDIYNNEELKNTLGLGLNIYGKKIRCLVCDSLEHVQKDCNKLSRKNSY